MNEISLSGRITAMSKGDVQPNDSAAHCILRISVGHRTRSGETRMEVFTVHAWNKLAHWAQNNIALGNYVLIRGYISLYGAASNRRTDITATHIFRCMEDESMLVPLAMKEKEVPQQEGGEADGRELANHP